MSDNRLPKTIEPKRLAEQGRQLLGEIALADMLRLSSQVVAANDAAHVIIDAGIDSEGRPYLKGETFTVVQLQCQRCMQPYEEKIAAEFCLVPVTHEHEAKQLPDHYEALLVENYTVEVATMIEDELLLALPIVPRHPVNECPVQFTHPHKEAGLSEKLNPFLVLESLKQKK